MAQLTINGVEHQDVMTVKELRDLLNDFPNDYPIVLSKDGEGNGFSPLANSYTEAEYHPDSTWSGEIDTEQGHTANCLVLWPVN